MSRDTKMCQGKEVFERMNFLYQASRLLSTKNQTIASYYGNVMMGCAKKAVLRVEPEIKRSLCKYCHSPQIPGQTARVRVKAKRTVKWTCLKCLKNKSFATKKDHKLWVEQPESLIEVIDYAGKQRQKVSNDSSTTKEQIEKPPVS